MGELFRLFINQNTSAYRFYCKMKTFLFFLLIALVTGKDSSGRPECFKYDENGVKTKYQCKRYNTGFGTYDSCYYIETPTGAKFGGCGVSEGKSGHDGHYCNKEEALDDLEFSRFEIHFCCQEDLCNTRDKDPESGRRKLSCSISGKYQKSNLVFAALIFVRAGVM